MGIDYLNQIVLTNYDSRRIKRTAYQVWQMITSERQYYSNISGQINKSRYLFKYFKDNWLSIYLFTNRRKLLTKITQQDWINNLKQSLFIKINREINIINICVQIEWNTFKQKVQIQCHTFGSYNILTQNHIKQHKSSIMSIKSLNNIQLEIAGFIFSALLAQVLFIQSVKMRRYPLLKNLIAAIIGYIYAHTIQEMTDSRMKYKRIYFIHMVMPPIIFATGYWLPKIRQKSILVIQLAVIGLSCFVLYKLLTKKTLSLFTLKSALIILAIIIIIAYFVYLSLKNPQKFPLIHSIIYGQGCTQKILFILMHRAISIKNPSKPSFLTNFADIFDPLQFDMASLFRIIAWWLFSEFLLLFFKSQNRPDSKRNILLDTISILLIEYFIYFLFVLFDESGITPLFVFSIVIGRHAFTSQMSNPTYRFGFSYTDVTSFTQVCVNIYLGALIFMMDNKLPIVLYLLLSLQNSRVQRNRCTIDQTHFSQNFMDNVLPDLDGETQDEMCNKIWEFRPTQKWIAIFQQMKNTNIEQLYSVFEDTQPDQIDDGVRILIFIQRIQFTNIKTLSLTQSGIQNIESICNLSMDSLQYVAIDNNFITCLKAFDKIKWPSLKNISLQGNKLLQTSVSRAGIGSLEYLEFNYGNEKHIQVHNPSVFAKSPSQQISRLVLQHHLEVIYSIKIHLSLERSVKFLIVQWGNQASVEQQFED